MCFEKSMLKRRCNARRLELLPIRLFLVLARSAFAETFRYELFAEPDVRQTEPEGGVVPKVLDKRNVQLTARYQYRYLTANYGEAWHSRQALDDLRLMKPMKRIRWPHPDLCSARVSVMAALRRRRGGCHIGWRYFLAIFHLLRASADAATTHTRGHAGAQNFLDRKRAKSRAILLVHRH